MALIGVLPDHVAFSRPAHGTVVCVGGIPLVLVVLYDCCTGQLPSHSRATLARSSALVGASRADTLLTASGQGGIDIRPISASLRWASTGVRRLSVGLSGASRFAFAPVAARSGPPLDDLIEAGNESVEEFGEGVAFVGVEGFEGFGDDCESSGRDSALCLSAEGCGVDECDSLVGRACVPLGEADLDEATDGSRRGGWVDAERGREFAHGPAAMADE